MFYEINFMNEKKEINEKGLTYMKYNFDIKTKIFVFALLIIIGYNIRNSKKNLTPKNILKTNNSFKPIVNIKKNESVKIKHNKISSDKIEATYSLLLHELENKNLSEINKKRTFEKRYPLPDEIKCSEHLKDGGLIDMLAFTSFLTNNTIFFEFASGCSSIIAKYYSKKSYAVEGNKKWYDIGISQGLKENLLFKDLKCDGKGPLLSWPGKESTLEDWKSFIQAYKEEYNADVFLIDGRFRAACALDIFGKIKNDAVVLLHECQRKDYSIVEKYYNKVYKWKNLCLFQKKKDIKEIPLEVLEKYWNNKV